MLTTCGAEVVSVGSAIEALDQMERQRFDLLISDIGMPEMNGYDLISRIRQLGEEHGGRTPAVALTAYAGIDDRNRALYFSRAPIPFARNWEDALLTSQPASFHQHIGLYAYRRQFLLRIAELPRSASEKIENLEQLRVLAAGYDIAVGVIDEPTIGIDTPEDYRAFVERWKAG